MSAMIIFKH